MKVAPFKPQNMSLNSAVAADGGEIARAQALQAQAARVPALVDMNPVLLKPSSDTRAQVVVAGKPLRGSAGRGLSGSETHACWARCWPRSTGSSEKFDAVIVEGAGSPAEVNLRANDIANMGFAEAVGLPGAAGRRHRPRRRARPRRRHARLPERSPSASASPAS